MDRAPKAPANHSTAALSPLGRLPLTRHFPSGELSQGAHLCSPACCRSATSACMLQPVATHAAATESRGRLDGQQDEQPMRSCSDAAAPAPSPPVQMLRKHIPASGALMALLLCVAASYVAGQGNMHDMILQAHRCRLSRAPERSDPHPLGRPCPRQLRQREAQGPHTWPPTLKEPPGLPLPPAFPAATFLANCSAIAAKSPPAQPGLVLGAQPVCQHLPRPVNDVRLFLPSHHLNRLTSAPRTLTPSCTFTTFPKPPHHCKGVLTPRLRTHHVHISLPTPARCALLPCQRRHHWPKLLQRVGLCPPRYRRCH